MGMPQSKSPTVVPPVLQLPAEQQEAAVKLVHTLNTLTCMISEHFTSLGGLKTEVAEIREKADVMGGQYKHNQQLEELRTLESRLGDEQKALERAQEQNKREREALMDEKRKVKEERDQLYRMLEQLKAKGIEVGPKMSVLHHPTATTAGNLMAGGGEVQFYSSHLHDEGGTGGVSVGMAGDLHMHHPGGSGGARTVSPNSSPGWRTGWRAGTKARSASGVVS